jgi:hypothetical protein
MSFWVGVLKGQYENHEVFSSSKDPEPEDFPKYDYVVGPFSKKKEAEKKAREEKNQTGMFHPFPGHPR